MATRDARPNVPLVDCILIHLWEQDHQADHYLVRYEVTRPGIAEICALHPPNVSRSMRELMTSGWVTEHTRTIRWRRSKAEDMATYGRWKNRGQR
jgi:cAMP-binding proteins - catabolite gene activator and regulatory subunit of cAMP-dependent protein kinases